jgi:AcrR family transcriptional regulator
MDAISNKKMNPTKDKILECALDLFLSDGYKGLSMRKIALCAGVSPTAIYRHYDDKEALFHIILKKGFTMLMSYLKPALEGETALERLRLSVQYYLDFMIEKPKYCELIFIKNESRDELASHEELRAYSKTTFDFDTRRIQECMDSGDLKQDSASEVSLLLLSTYVGFFSLYVSGLLPRSESQLKELYWHSMDRIFKGLNA